MQVLIKSVNQMSQPLGDVAPLTQGWGWRVEMGVEGESGRLKHERGGGGGGNITYV